MNNPDIKMQCLQMAIQVTERGGSSKSVIELAEDFYKFVTGVVRLPPTNDFLKNAA